MKFDNTFNTKSPVRKSFLGVTITPEFASYLLEYNTANFRKETQFLIKEYAKEMSLGHWSISNSPISFNIDGILDDGQNRLYACVKSKTSFNSDILLGQPLEAAKNYDCGKNRTVSERLQVKKRVGPVLRLIASDYITGFSGKDITEIEILKNNGIGTIVEYILDFHNGNKGGFTTAAELVAATAAIIAVGYSDDKKMSILERYRDLTLGTAKHDFSFWYKDNKKKLVSHKTHNTVFAFHCYAPNVSNLIVKSKKVKDGLPAAFTVDMNSIEQSTKLIRDIFNNYLVNNK